MIPALEKRDTLWWPKGEDGSWIACHREARNVDRIMELCAQRRLAVQAGANGGIVPLRLASRFGEVIAFEPFLGNFCAARLNLDASENVTLYMAALGAKSGSCRVTLRDGGDISGPVSNSGALQTRPSGVIPVMTIDMLALPVCDLIMLDVEGDELPALRGAVQTINRHRPVIAAEDKGLGSRYGIPFGAISDWLTGELGYEPAGMFGHDFAYRPRSLA